MQVRLADGMCPTTHAHVLVAAAAVTAVAPLFAECTELVRLPGTQLHGLHARNPLFPHM